MRISGKFLPAPSNPVNKDLSDNRQPLSERNLDTGQKHRQQTVEYVFKGEILEEVASEDHNRTPYPQSIDPANQSAISSYSNSSSQPPRQGHLVDIFV
ncbi:MAG: hypothetical protein KAU21_09180 [Gammaproteobacteria bacterium]|nr:hypothetical protein [Gammaproteobacteria bacterium]